MSEGRLLAHLALDTRHQCVEEEVGTGIRSETHTPLRADGTFGEPRVYYYHRDEPQHVTHDSYAEALAANVRLR